MRVETLSSNMREGGLDLSLAVHGPLLEAMNDPVIVLAAGEIRFANRALAELLECRHWELVDSRFDDIVLSDNWEQVSFWMNDNGANQFENLRIDVSLRSGSGEARWVSIRLQSARWEGNESFVGFISDLEEKRRGKEVAEQLMQAQKMEAVGRLAGGVAHDMNNVLGAIMGFGSVLQAELDPEDPARSDVDHILEACQKGRDVMLNLLGFARKGKYRLELFTLNDRVRQVVELLKHAIPKKITIETELCSDTVQVHGDPTQIHQAIMHICLNAVDAMGDSGTLTLVTDTLNLRTPLESAYPELSPGVYARLMVGDTGTGMDPSTLKKAFEPFFTTKPVGQGSGMGLPMVYGTVLNHGGAATLDSTPDLGTHVTVLLPWGASPSQSLPTVADKRTPSDPAMASVLLVDDEEIIRQAGKRLLEKLGYRVLLAQDGRDAIRIFCEKKDSLSLVMLDLVMPVMDGEETLAKMKEIDPEVPVLLCSGYSKEEKADELLGKGADGFIQKPFDLADLRSGIESALEE